MGPSMVHRHRDVQGGTARAAVFGVSDGLVSNVALILGIAGATSDPAVIRVAGVSGLLAGAVSMAAGEYISLKAQTELVERELQIERESIAENPEDETEELAAIYRERGLGAEEADQVAEVLMSDPDVALDVHAREELGVDPTQLGNPTGAAAASFGAFALGALVPLLPWLGGSGDAAEVGIGEVVAGVRPDGKVQAVLDLRSPDAHIAMVGDGLNDTPALAAADLGIAIGGGTDAATEAAGVVLLTDDLRAVADAIALSRRTVASIRTNLVWAFLYNVAALPLAVAGALAPPIAAGAMVASSLFVVGNSLRLRSFTGSTN